MDYSLYEDLEKVVTESHAILFEDETAIVLENSAINWFKSRGLKYTAVGGIAPLWSTFVSAIFLAINLVAMFKHMKKYSDTPILFGKDKIDQYHKDTNKTLSIQGAALLFQIIAQVKGGQIEANLMLKKPLKERATTYSARRIMGAYAIVRSKDLSQKLKSKDYKARSGVIMKHVGELRKIAIQHHSAAKGTKYAKAWPAIIKKLEHLAITYRERMKGNE
jgi:hypothetical protein